MGKPTKKKKVSMAERQAKVCELYLQGRYQHEIALILNVSTKTVSRDLKEAEERWLTEAATSVEQRRATEVAKLNDLERTYHRAWLRSLRIKEECIESQTEKVAGVETKSEKRRARSEGNPAFLAGRERCIMHRCKLLGLDREVSGEGMSGGGGITVLMGVDADMILGRKKDPLAVGQAGSEGQVGDEGAGAGEQLEQSPGREMDCPAVDNREGEGS